MKKTSGILLLLGLVGFAYGLYHLFELRFAGGDSYPQYSSLRADPLGSKALLESLEPLVATERNFHALRRLGDGAATTALFLGMPPETFSLLPSEWLALESFARSGGRLVIALSPAYQKRWQSPFTTARGRPTLPPISGTNSPGNPPEPSPEARPRPVTERWAIQFDYVPLERDGNGSYLPAQARRREPAPASLPTELDVHTACTFSGLDGPWQVLYARRGATNDLPVLIQRSLGRGTVVLAADSFPFSNESLREEPNTPLLAWMVGASRRVVFDETHLGVTVEPGLAALARQYRLGSAVVALLILAGLFIWKNATSFLPRPEAQDSPDAANVVEGRDSASGFINLLRRHLPPTELMATCLEQWNAERSTARRPARARLEAMQQRIDTENSKDPGEREPVALYRDLAAILSPRHPHAPAALHAAAPTSPQPPRPSPRAPNTSPHDCS